jgi:hypothetical protein
MATRTQQDLATAVLQDLRLIAAEETPSAADRAYVINRYTEALEELRDDGLVWWDANAIPYAVFPAVVYYVGLVVSPGFGISINGNIDDALEGAKRRLRRRVAKRSTGEATELSDY